MRGMLRPFDRMSLRAMVGLQTLVGFSEDAIAIFGELLADDDVESEVLKLVDPREPPLASSENLAGSQEGVDSVPGEVWGGALDRKRVVEGKGGEDRGGDGGGGTK